MKETKNTKSIIYTTDIRSRLKEIIFKEMENLPSDLEALETKDKINVICKLIPYVLPKVEAVHFTNDENNFFNLP